MFVIQIPTVSSFQFQDFIPYQLTHCEVVLNGSSVETVWVLLGSDNLAHVYVEDPLSHSYVDAKEMQRFRKLFPELDRVFPSVPVILFRNILIFFLVVG